MLRQRRRTLETIRGAAALLVLSQLIFWVGIGLAESLARPDAIPGPASIAMYYADENGRQIPSLSPVNVPLLPEPAYGHTDEEQHPRALFRYQFERAELDREFGILLGWSRRIVDVRLNGVPLKTQSPSDIWGILGGFEPVVYSFPREYLNGGTNTLEIQNSGRKRKVLPYFYVGNLAALYTAHTWSRVFSVDLVLASIGVMLFTMLLCLLVDWPAQDRVRVLSLVLLLGAWILRNLTFLGIDGGLPDPLRLLAHFVVTYMFLFAFLVFALGWTRRPAWTFKLAAAAFVAVCVAAAFATAMSAALLFRSAWWIETSLTIAIGAAVLLLFAEYWTKHNRKETVEVLLFLVCMSAIVADAVDDRWQITVPFVPDLYLTFYAAPMCGLLLALGMVASLAAQSTRARIATENVNELLNTKLNQQEKRLLASYEREKAMEKQQVLVDERQRIIRDMHDGVGGSMMSLLMQARRDELSNEQLVNSLSANISDLRLIIDSFDHVGDNLEFALSVFRQRVEPQLSARGVKLHYATSAASAISGFGPESVLQIYRILQEACNNAVNHGNAKNICIRLSTDEPGGLVRIGVQDDGFGIDPDKPSRGRGLDNMRHRAQRLDGRIDIERDEETGGTRVVLTFPQRPSESISA